jgi:hypothetical protein
LGISSSATADEIKAAFRRLAKETHPDHSNSSNANARFQAINQAHEILGNPEKRAAYDNIQYQATREEDATSQIVEPVVCSKCHKITAQPRYAVFWYVVSVFLATFRNPLQGIYCATCARKVALQASIISAVVGWWGIPWGPIHTVKEILKNASGGYEPPDSREALLWRNAVAFASRGNGALAYALARDLRRARDEKISQGAIKLMEYLRSKGVDPDEAYLKPAWEKSSSQFALHLLALALVPAVIFAIVAFNGAGNSSASTQLPSWQTMSAAPDQAADTSTESTPSTSGSSVDATSNVPTCAVPPSNGDVLESGGSRLEANKLTVQNGSSGNAIIKIRDSNSGALVASFFVVSNSTASYPFIPDGSFTIQYAFGDALDATCSTFAIIKGAAQFPDTEIFATEYSNTEVVHHELTYTLYGVSGGNVVPNAVDAAAFNAK